MNCDRRLLAAAAGSVVLISTSTGVASATTPHSRPVLPSRYELKLVHGNYAFRSPSGNIECSLTRGLVRCDLIKLDHPRSARHCHGDFGHAFGMHTGRRAALLCVSDAAGGPGSRVLPYGASLSVYAFTCTSSRAGIACTTTHGHRMVLSRQRQTLR